MMKALRARGEGGATSFGITRDDARCANQSEIMGRAGER
jgi:hypothetical protein